MQLRFLRHGEYDKQLYNSCIHYANNGSIYGYDWFLNNTAREWDLIVEGDPYVSVLPLPRATNWRGQLQLRQPPLVPDLAIYSVKPLSPVRVNSFWEAVPAEFKSGELEVEPLSVPSEKSRFKFRAASGTNLDLNQPYEQIIDDFPASYLRDLGLAEAADLLPTGTLKPERVAAFFQAHSPKGKATEWAFHAIQRLMYQLLHRGWGSAYGVQNRQGDVLAMVFIAYSHGRLFPIVKVESPAGKKAGAMSLLWDMAIHSHAERPLRIKREELFPGGE
ncbi:MAG: hypothetical protein AAF433_16605 [Bacteroidota bacterium]